MPKPAYDRLSAQDQSFLEAEHDNVPLHVAAVGIYEVGDMGRDDGGVDVRKFKQATEAQLHRIPRYRQKLAWVPIEGRAVWVDDPHFNLDYHIRHAALPKPGGVEELKRLTARITTRPLDRTRPLWEIWVIEGLAGDRFAIVSKIHHCMVDGASGADVAQILMSPSPEYEVGEPVPFRPRPGPTAGDLLADYARRQAGMPFRALSGLRALSRDVGLPQEIGTHARAIGDLLSWTFTPSSDTPINGPLGPHRRIDWLTLSLDDVRAIRRNLDCTVNDVVLATVTGAMRYYLSRHGCDPSDIDFRVSAPVSMRRDDEQGKLGNRVSTWIVPLPLAESSPLEWVKHVNAVTSERKRSNQALGADLLMQAAEYAPPGLMALGARAAAGPINMIVTNVPGPQFPLYILGAKLVEMHPLVPLLDGTGLGIALFSYDGRIHVGLNAEYDLVPDLSTFTALFAQAFMQLLDAAGVGAPAEESDPAPCEAQPIANDADAEAPLALRPAAEQRTPDDVEPLVDRLASGGS